MEKVFVCTRLETGWLEIITKNDSTGHNGNRVCPSRDKIKRENVGRDNHADQTTIACL